MNNHPKASNHTLDKSKENTATTTSAILLAVSVLLTASTMRSPITGVGPLTGEIQASTGLSHTATGMLTTLPLIAFAIFALAAPKLSDRLGANRTLFACMILMTVGITIRSLPGIVPLFGGMALLGISIAIANVLIPSMIKRDFPLRLGLMTALYTSTMNLLSAVASGVSLPLARTGLGWRGSLACWALLSTLSAAVWFVVIRKQRFSNSVTGYNDNANASASAKASIAATKKQTHGKLWRSPIAWQVALFMASQSIMFYVSVSWLPEVLTSKGLSMDQGGWMLSLMQISSMAGSFLMPLFAAKTASQHWLAAASSAMFLIGFGGIWLGPVNLALPFILLIGIGCGTTFALVILFFALRTQSAERAADLSGMAQSLGYLMAASGPALFGFIHDQSGNWSTPLAVITGYSLITIILGYLSGRAGYVETSIDAGGNAQNK